MKPFIRFVLPAYNEGENIVSLLDKINNLTVNHNISVVAVNDGSQDDTLFILQSYTRFQVVTVNHLKNTGLGQTLFDGLKEAAELSGDDDVIVTMDADDTHDPSQVEAMLLVMSRDQADIVVASRFRKGAEIYGLKPWRKILSYGAALIFITLRPSRGLRDYTCGYRLMKASALKKMIGQYGDQLITENGFAATAQFILRARKMKMKFAEIPLLLYYDRKLGVSKMNILKTIQRSLMLCFRDLV